MDPIVKRLHEAKQIELAKEILMGAGYKITRMNESKDKFSNLELELPDLDFSHIKGAYQTSKDSPIHFDDPKDAVEYKRAQGMELRKINNLSTDKDVEDVCDYLKSLIIDKFSKQGKSALWSDEYFALVALAATLEGHVTGGYGTYSAYADITKYSPYSRESIQKSTSMSVNESVTEERETNESEDADVPPLTKAETMKFSELTGDLKKDIETAVHEFMVSKGFPEDEADDYTRVDIRDNSDSTVVEVGAELSYNNLTKLADVLDPIIAKIDKNAYFDMDEPGIMSAYIMNKKERE